MGTPTGECCRHSHGCCSISHPPDGAGSAFLGGTASPPQDGIAPRGWTTHAASSDRCQQPGWAPGFPPAARRAGCGAHLAPAAGGFPRGWELGGSCCARTGTWAALPGLEPPQAPLGAAPVGAHPHRPRVSPFCSPRAAHFPSLATTRAKLGAPQCHIPGPGTSRGVPSTLPPSPPPHRDALCPSWRVGELGSSWLLPSVLEIQNICRAAHSRPAATERGTWLTPLLSLAAAPSCSRSGGFFSPPPHPSLFFFPFFFFLFPVL